MKNWFLPDHYVHSCLEVEPEKLKEHGVRLCILDIDNTLVPSDSEEVGEEEIRYVQDLKDAGIIPVAISNNMAGRTLRISKALNTDCIFFALKPLRPGLYRALKRYQVSPQECVIVGDQLITDICGGNRMGIFTILVDPKGNDNIFGKISRRAEKLILKYYKKKGLFDKGDNDGEM
jgi:HAD superfamily phosphatase (TIGR01668 family)